MVQLGRSGGLFKCKGRKKITEGRSAMAMISMKEEATFVTSKNNGKKKAVPGSHKKEASRRRY